MTQQTIGNTVYTVGQRTTARRLLESPVGTEFKRLADPLNCLLEDHRTDLFCFEITALPNLNPVADEWREVVHPDKRAGGYPEAMQEVCKAERVWHMWPDFTEWGGNEPLPTDDGMPIRDFGLIAETVDITIRCFLLGGKVSVKGGV